MTDGDREVAQRARDRPGLPPARALRRHPARALRRLLQPDREPDPVVPAPLPLGHRAHAGVRRGDRGDWEQYIEANRSFAMTLAEEGDRDPVYLIQDYHLALVPGDSCASSVPDARIVHFSHTPFAGRDVPPHPPVAHARCDPARHGGRRRGRVPGPAVGRELPPVGAGTARVPRPARRTIRDGRSRGHGAGVPGGGERALDP